MQKSDGLDLLLEEDRPFYRCRHKNVAVDQVSFVLGVFLCDIQARIFVLCPVTLEFCTEPFVRPISDKACLIMSFSVSLCTIFYTTIHLCMFEYKTVD